MAAPADACLYQRPFPDGFDECVAYQPFLASAADSARRSLSTLWTCRHLEPAPREGGGGFYARCRVGTAGDRRRWAEADPARPGLTRLRRALAARMRPWYAAIYEAKAASGRGAVTAATAAQEEFRRWVAESEAEVTAAGIDPLEFVTYHGEALDSLVRTPGPGLDWMVPETVVRKYSEPLRALARPDLLGQTAPGAPE